MSTTLPKRAKSGSSSGGGGGGSTSVSAPTAPSAMPDVQSFEEIYNDGIETDSSTVSEGSDRNTVKAYVVLDDIKDAESDSDNIDSNSSI